MAVNTPAEPDSFPVFPVAPLQQVLSALGDPIRFEIVRRLLGADGPVPCGQLYDGISKSTASHHLKILRESGITERTIENGRVHQRLRRIQIDAAYPHLLSTLAAAVPHP